ncbi:MULTISPECIES: hypothetical protein [Sphingobium]|jgi:hypothetical protein|uniref:Uncharacterized protein n=1 Tax=Sphingobium limneticum TaxID=1007511 RepID=A0A5J5HRA8_9SPHN|nr:MULTISPECIES: hypothetical protein [Sphingobium]KAA9012040.1 hypothetical protein F4U96_21860 [Sphingobium limneticum]KAA9020431.1 hypothetical protein F4U94_02400 [Sphingobium limneticum]KAA9024491.1 hypothetical protein F4U95_21975 [Sphingobium limneticum]BBD02862.1 hypothetical protein YGS_C2P0876 [Sphingobium sp. YG1]
MALVEVLEGEDLEKLLFVAEFDFLPRVGEHLARDIDGYFRYYHIVKIWHRQDATDGVFRACLLVTLDD